MAEARESQNGADRAGSENAGTACVLLCTGEAPEELLASLSERRVVIEAHADPFSAIAAVLRRGRTGSPLVLLVVDPARVARADEMVRTVERFVPHVVCWRYDAGKSPALRGYVPPPPAPSATIETFVSRARAGGPPKLRLAGHEPGGEAVREAPMNTAGAGDVRPEPAAKDAAGEAAPASAGGELLSSEELSMLLSDDWSGSRRAGESGS